MFLERVQGMLLPASPSEEQLGIVAEALCRLACSPAWQHCPYHEAVAGEELLYELAVSADNGPSLYLVSDGATVVSPPHGHGTWAVIVGIRGREVNHLYVVSAGDDRVVVRTSTVEIGPGEALVLSPREIHSTAVAGDHATFHLHLYAQPLHSLPSFESRCYSTAVGPGAHHKKLVDAKPE